MSSPAIAFHDGAFCILLPFLPYQFYCKIFLAQQRSSYVNHPCVALVYRIPVGSFNCVVDKQQLFFSRLFFTGVGADNNNRCQCWSCACTCFRLWYCLNIERCYAPLVPCVEMEPALHKCSSGYKFYMVVILTAWLFQNLFLQTHS